MNTFNYKLVLQKILDEPKNFNQTKWHCGTAHCFGGLAQLLSGSPPSDYWVRHDARKFLELTKAEADYLFQSGRTVEDFQKFLEELGPTDFSWDGFNQTGYDQMGFHRDGYNKDGFDRYGYDKQGFNKDGWDLRGYNRTGFDADGFDLRGFDREGYTWGGYDKRGFDRDGYDRDGLDINFCSKK